MMRPSRASLGLLLRTAAGVALTVPIGRVATELLVTGLGIAALAVEVGEIAVEEAREMVGGLVVWMRGEP